MNPQTPLSGTGAALVTPFRNRAIDYDALSRLIEHTLEGGVDFLVALGTTGEAITQSPEECRSVLSFTVEEVKGRVPVVAGLFGSNYTEKLVNALRSYDFEGIAAVMSSSPAYSKPTQEGIYQHYLAVADASPVPVIIYNVPGRTSSNIKAATTLRLARSSEQFIGIKEASGDIAQAISILKDKPAHFQVWSGEDPLTLPLIACGATGVISVIANAFPRQFSGMVQHALAGQFLEARRLNDQLHDIHPFLYADGNPAGIKGALEMLGLCSKETRIPLTPLSDQTYFGLHQALKKSGLLP